MRAFMTHLGRPTIPIGVGSIFPLGKENELLVRYLHEHTIRGVTYEGDGLIECFPSAGSVIIDAVRTYGEALKIAALAPLTDLAIAVREYPEEMRSVGGIYIQGQATVENGRLVPNPEAYNIQQDMEAATIVLALQDRVPFTFVGKHAANQVPLGRAVFDAFAATGNPAGSYLRTHAIKGMQCFAEREPELFRRLYEASPDVLSKPYDAVVAARIARPELLAPVYLGRHALIGMTPETPGVPDAERLRGNIVGTIMHALVQSS
jgi:inosine-uridine nucleoside N-ribohydrolase